MKRDGVMRRPVIARAGSTGQNLSALPDANDLTQRYLHTVSACDAILWSVIVVRGCWLDPGIAKANACANERWMMMQMIEGSCSVLPRPCRCNSKLDVPVTIISNSTTDPCPCLESIAEHEMHLGKSHLRHPSLSAVRVSFRLL